MGVLTMDEARQIAIGITRIPRFLGRSGLAPFEEIFFR